MGLTRDLEQVAKGWRWTRRRVLPASVERERDPAKDFPTAWGRTPVGRAAREVVQRFGLSPLLHFEVETEVCGRDVLDTIEPPAIFVLNHSSHLDAPTILTALPTRWRRKAVVGAASDYFFDTWYRSIATTVVFNAFPIARSGGLRSARMARQLISEGWSLVLFPEGSRTPDGWVGEFRTGAAWLAMEAGVPVVPVALIGAYQAMPRGRSWPKPGRPPVRIRFGLPIRPLEGERSSAFSDRLRQGLGKVLEEDHSSWWNAIRLDASGELFDPGGPQVATWRRMWESSRPIRPSRAKSVWSPDTHEWEAEHLWSGAGWQTAAEPGPDAGPATAAPEQETLFPEPEIVLPEPVFPEPEIVLPEPAPVGDWKIALVPFDPNQEEEPASAPGGATEAALARVEEVLAQAMQDDGPHLQPPLPDETSGTPAEPTAGELARIEALLDKAFPRHDDPGPGDPGDDAFFEVNVVEGDPPAEGSPETSESPPATRPDRPLAERGWFLTRRPRRGQPPR
ncbi:MAG: phospholipid/glycerol acyltransferase [Actinobacteria bacterium]|nr:phospholipid/glycerol acyltransferase [Actinomycetota bacterium]